MLGGFVLSSIDDSVTASSAGIEKLDNFSEIIIQILK